MPKNLFEELVQVDYEALLDDVNLDTSDDVKQLLLLQSVLGHAHEGHSFFADVCFGHGECGVTFPEATMEDIVQAVKLNPHIIKQKRQEYIDEVFDFLWRILSCEDVRRYCNRRGEPLFRINCLGDKIMQDIRDLGAVLTGFYIGSRMDSYVWRKKVEERYGVKIGGGECVGVNLEKAKSENISLEQLAKEEHTQEEVKSLINMGVICVGVQSTENIVHAFVRYTIGHGTSDDLAVIHAGKLYGADAAKGLFLCDAVDTWDKYTPFILRGGQDEKIGDIIEEKAHLLEKRFGKIMPDEDELIKFIYLIAKGNYEKMVSSSQRYFLEIDKNTGITSIKSHLSYIHRGKRPKKMRVGHVGSTLTNLDMYGQYAKKFRKIYNNYK